MGSLQFLLAAARCLLIGGAMLWAALNIRFAGRMSVDGTSVLEAYGYVTALLFLIGASATARFGSRATIGLAAPVIALLAVAATYIGLGESPTPASNLYLALIFENLAVLSVALALSGAAARLDDVQKRLN